MDNVNLLWEELKDMVKVCYAIDNFEWEVLLSITITDTSSMWPSYGRRPCSKNKDSIIVFFRSIKIINGKLPYFSQYDSLP